MRLIDADKLMEDFPIRIHRYDKEHGNLHFVLGVESVMEYINDNMPTIEPVKRGKWINTYGDTPHDIRDKNNWWHCSECKYPATTLFKSPHCPNCGAKMESEAE